MTAKTKGLIRSNKNVLSLNNAAGSFAVNVDLKMNKVEDNSSIFKGAEQPQNIITFDAASAIIVEDKKTYRLPKNEAFANHQGRICREVATEREISLTFMGHSMSYRHAMLRALPRSVL